MEAANLEFSDLAANLESPGPPRPAGIIIPEPRSPANRSSGKSVTILRQGSDVKRPTSIGEDDAKPLPAPTPWAQEPSPMSPTVSVPERSGSAASGVFSVPPISFVSMRGGLLSSGRSAPEPTWHPSTGVSGATPFFLDTGATPLHAKGHFSMRGELMHAFVSYRVSTEGGGGNGLSGRISERIRSLSIDGEKELQIPRHGWGVWLQSAKQPEPFRPEEAKVFLDKDCLQDGQSWLAGFIQGLSASMIFVPLLSWTEDDRGSVGELAKIGVNGFDRVDNVLLELIIAMALREEPGAAVQAVLPVLIGQAKPAGDVLKSSVAGGGQGAFSRKDGSATAGNMRVRRGSLAASGNLSNPVKGFEAFPFHKLGRLSDEPSKETSAKAGKILRQLGLGEHKVQEVMTRSVKTVVDQVLRNQGVQASDWDDEDGLVTECGMRVLKTVLNEMRRLRSDPKYFEQGRPMGSEVLEWLQKANLRSYAPLFVYHHLDSLESVARMTSIELRQLFDEYEELYPRSGRKGAIGAELKKLAKAHGALTHVTPHYLFGLLGGHPDQRVLPLSARLEGYRDTEASATAAASSGNGMELIHTKTVLRLACVLGWTSLSAVLFAAFISGEYEGTRGVSRAIMASLCFVGACLPIVCKNARVFVQALQLFMLAFFSVYCFILLLDSSTYFTFLFWTPCLAFTTFLLVFRPRWFLFGGFGVKLFGNFLEGSLICIWFDYSSVPSEIPNFGACVVNEYRKSAGTSCIFGFSLLFIVSRKLMNDFLARRAARSSRDRHRALWRKELGKVAGSPEVMEGMKRLTDKIAKELQDQRKKAVWSLGVVARVTAFLYQRTGRWSLRGSRSKARQAHGDIDLLFDEAAMVNEPFLDLMGSLMASIRVAGEGGGYSQANSIASRGSSAWSGEAGSRPGLTLERGPVKKPQRALQKLVRVYGRDVAMLTDLVRCTVVAEDLQQVAAMMAMLDSRAVLGLEGAASAQVQEGDEEEMILLDSLSHANDDRMLRITAISNRFDESYTDNESGGYRDLSLNIEVGWVMREGVVSFERERDWEGLECQRHICEMQVHLRSQHHQIVNEGLHTRFVELRNKFNT